MNPLKKPQIKQLLPLARQSIVKIRVICGLFGKVTSFHTPPNDYELVVFTNCSVLIIQGAVGIEKVPGNYTNLLSACKVAASCDAGRGLFGQCNFAAFALSLNATFGHGVNIEQSVSFFWGEVAFFQNYFTHGTVGGHGFFCHFSAFGIADYGIKGGDENGIFG